MKRWILAAVAMGLAAVGAACGGDDQAPPRTCDHIADVQACYDAIEAGETRCSYGADLDVVSVCKEQVYRDAATCLYCAPCLEYAPRYECVADCEPVFVDCLHRGNNVAACQSAKTACYVACDNAHTCLDS